VLVVGVIGCHYLGVILLVNSEKKENKIGRCVGIRIVIYLFVPIVILIGQPCVDRFTCCTHKRELCSSVSVGFECAV